MEFPAKWLRAAAAGNWLSVLVAIRRPGELPAFVSSIWKKYREITGAGLPARDPLTFLFESGAVPFDPDIRIQFPPVLHGGGGTRQEELLCLAAVARVLSPVCVFEIGTFTGLTTALFILNSPTARVISLDLPPDAIPAEDYIERDVHLVQERKTGHYLQVLGLADRYEQMLEDSMKFDPALLANTVELGFIDGSHALRYVVNDTEKMARMITDRGLVFWHDYGGIGEARELAAYLESLAAKAPIYQVAGTSLAWATGKALKSALAS